MSKRRVLKERLATLDEIESIMSAMKNLALLEIRKLEVFLTTQRKALNNMDAVVDDFLGFYPQLLPDVQSLQQLWVLIGSERGFCGDFNETLLQFLDQQGQQNDLMIMAIGRRLEAKLHADERVVTLIPGHSVAEEIQNTILHLVQAIDRCQSTAANNRIGRISAVYYDDDTETVQQRQLLPLAASQSKPGYAYAPLLNLQPDMFLAQLTDQYLYAALHEVFYSSLMVENRKRLAHMDRAINRLEKDESRLQLRYNQLRQEEIIEEIEVILLSAEALTETDEPEKAAEYSE